MYAKEAGELSNKNNKKLYDGEILFVLSYIRDCIGIGERKCEYYFDLNKKSKADLKRLGYKVRKCWFGFVEYVISW